MSSPPRPETVPWWGLASSAATPCLLIGGWTLAAHRQPGLFDPVTETISALAAADAADRWLMTAALYGVGVCHVVTALALRPAARPGRVVLATGGVATALVAALPLPAEVSGVAGSRPHTVAAVAAFTALAAWPAVSWRHPGRSTGRRGGTPPALRPHVALGAAAALTAAVGWFFAEVLTEGPRIGLTERVAAGAQALWPLAVVLNIRGYRKRSRMPR